MSIHAASSTARGLSWLALVPALLLPGKALASPGIDDSFVDPRLVLDRSLDLDPPLDLDPRFDPPERARAPSPIPPLRAPMTLSLGVGYQQTTPGEPAWSVTAMLGLPLERLAARAPVLGDDARGAPPKVDPAPPPPPPKLPVPPAAPLRVPVVVTPDVARAAVEAALRHAHLEDPDKRLDAIATRARKAAALPELTLRVLRTVDTGQTLSPTSYDPTRVTAVDSVKYYVEGRASWHLDRLVFGTEELRLERMRYNRANAQARLRGQVLKLLFEWQRALAITESPLLLPEENLAARLKALEAEAELDIVTGGWFTTWRTAQTAQTAPAVPVTAAP